MSGTHSNKKPRSSIPFLPDPSKWIQTEPSSVKKPLNRPLVGFKNTFATPPTTVKRAPTQATAHNRARAQDDTPTASGSGSGRQGLLNAFMTPPSTSITDRQSNTNNSHPGTSTAKRRVSPLNKSAGKSKLAIHVDDDSDTEMRTKTRPMTRPLQSHRSAPVTSSSSGMSDARDQEAEITPIRRRKKQRRTLTSSPSPPLFDHDHDRDTTEHGAHDTPVASHVSSDRPITPVPDYVLDIHRRLCGRDTERMKRVKSPWRTTPKPTSPNKNKDKNQPTPVPAPRSKSSRMEEYKRHEVDVRAHDQALAKRRKKQDTKEQENKVQLVRDSSQVENEETTPKKRKRDIGLGAGQVLSPRPTNTPAKRIHQATLIKSPIRRQARVPADGKFERLVPDYSMDEDVSVGSGPLAVYQAFRAPSPRIRTPRKLKRIPTGTSPRSAISLASPSPSSSPTPIKHHNTTPPKNTTPTKRESPSGSSLIMTSPDLGDFAVPPQPIFTRSPSKTQDFRPVPMDAETLMTWSLGPQHQPQQPTEGEGSRRPDPRPIQGERGHDSQMGDSGETQSQSLAPSAKSQSFPNLLLSPTRPHPGPTTGPNRTTDTTARPSVVFLETMQRSTILDPNNDHPMSRKVPSLARFPTNLGVAETLHPGSPSTSKDKSPTKPTPRARTPMSGWPSTGFGLDHPSSPSRLDKPPTTFNSPKVKRKARDSLPRIGSGSGEKQPKLASFGFFSDKPPKPVRGFERDWDQEEDLALEVDDDEEDQRQRQSQLLVDRPGLQVEGRLGGVPEAPPHPELRPAGLRELKRRREHQERLLSEIRDQVQDRHDGDGDEGGDGEKEEPLFPEASTSSRPGISTDDQSSLTTDDDLGMNGSDVDWYEGLEDRRSSEFGSIPEM